MSYVPTGGLTVEQEAALRAVDPAALRKLDVETRMDLLLRHSEYEARKREAFWNSLQAFATVALPVAAFLGVTTLFEVKKRG